MLTAPETPTDSETFVDVEILKEATLVVEGPDIAVVLYGIMLLDDVTVEVSMVEEDCELGEPWLARSVVLEIDGELEAKIEADKLSPEEEEAMMEDDVEDVVKDVDGKWAEETED